MSFTLEFWYYTATRSSGPVQVNSESDLEDVIADLIWQGSQPHPTQVYSPDLPTFGRLKLPDRMFKMDLDPETTVGALHYYGPDPNSEKGESWSWASVSNAEITNRPPVLYIDKSNRTEFPPDSAISLLTIMKSLDQFRLTGERPTCIQWQDTGGII